MCSAAVSSGTGDTRDFHTLTKTGENYETALAKLDEYFLPKKNVDYETFQFRQAKQKSDEMVEQFVICLRKLAVNCEFSALDKELKSAVIQNCSSKRLRRFVLREDDIVQSSSYRSQRNPS